MFMENNEPVLKSLTKHKLRAMRLRSYLLYNVSFIVFIVLVNALNSTSISARLKSTLPILVLLAINMFINRIKAAYFALFPFLKVLASYEELKLGDTDLAQRDIKARRVITIVLLLGLILMLIYPLSSSFNMSSLIAILVILNARQFIYNRKIDLM